MWMTSIILNTNIYFRIKYTIIRFLIIYSKQVLENVHKITMLINNQYRYKSNFFLIRMKILLQIFAHIKYFHTSVVNLIFIQYFIAIIRDGYTGLFNLMVNCLIYFSWIFFFLTLWLQLMYLVNNTGLIYFKKNYIYFSRFKVLLKL